jgi:ribosomal-protein-serine acetyltransferase
MPPPRRGVRATCLGLYPDRWHMFQLLVDDELSLILAEERHAEALNELIVRNRARLARWEPWAEQPPSVEGTRLTIRAALEDFARGRQVSTIISVDEGRRFIGRCGLRINPRAASGDIGYWIDVDYEGRGMASRAARRLISCAFEEMGLVRIELRTSVANRRSRALAERLGFTFQSVLPAGLVFSNRLDDVAFYALAATQWSPEPPVTAPTSNQWRSR